MPVPTGESAFGSDAPAVQALNGTLRFAQGVVVVADPTATYRMGVKGMFYLVGQLGWLGVVGDGVKGMF